MQTKRSITDTQVWPTGLERSVVIRWLLLNSRLLLLNRLNRGGTSVLRAACELWISVAVFVLELQLNKFPLKFMQLASLANSRKHHGTDVLVG